MEANELSQILKEFIPNAGSTKAISVGFENIDALVPLRMVLDDYVKKTSEKEKEIIDNKDKKNKEETKKIVKEWSKLFIDAMKEQKDVLDNISKRATETKEAAENLEKKIEEKNKKADVKDEDDSKKFKAFLKRFISGSIDVVKKHLDAAIEMGNVYADIESNGVFLKNGFEELGETANKLGMDYNELSSHLKKTSPLISKLNGSMGNGLKSFESAISSIDDKLNLTNREKVALFENVLSNMSPDQLMKMSQEQMNMEISKTAREMKMLAMATGKSVELINQENAQREATQRQQVWKRTHKEAFNVLKALGLDKDQEMMDYIMSGGGKPTANILTRMQNDPFMQQMMPQLIRMANANTLNMGSVANLYNQNKHLVGYKSSYANQASFNPAMLSASSSSNYFQNTAFDDTFGEAFIKMNLNGDMASQYYSDARAESNAALRNHIGLTRAMGRYDAAKQDALSGGVSGVKRATGIGEDLYNAGAWGINKFNSIFGGTVGGLMASTVAVNKEQIFAAAVDRFAWAVNLMIGSQLFQSFLGKGKGLLGKAGSAGAKVLGGIKNVGKGVWNLGKAGVTRAVGLGKAGATRAWNLANKDLGKVGKFGTIAGAAINIGMDVKRANEIGAENLLEEKRKNGLQGWDWINPYAWGQQLALHTGIDKVGGWIGEKGYDLLFGNKNKGNLKTPKNSEIKSSNLIATQEAKTSMDINKEMLQCMKDTKKSMEELCYINEEQKNVMYQTRIDRKTTGDKPNS